MHTTRRAVLATVAAGGVAGAAGCLGSVTGGGSGGCDLAARDPVDSLAAPRMGSQDAPVTVMAFEDFACPHCRTFSLDVVPRIESELVEPGSAVFEHHDLPIPVSERWSWAAASAARAVQDAVDDAAFFEYAHSLFENQDAYSMSLVQELATEVGADGCDVRAAAENGRYRPVLEADRQLGLDMGAGGTPAVFVDGRQVEPRFERIRAAVESAQG